MFIKIENEYGSINMDKRIIEKIVKYIINESPEVICLTNSKGQAVINMISDNMDSYLVDVRRSDEDILIRCYIIIKFGASIKRITHKLIQEIKRNVFEAVGVTPKTIFIYIKGIKSKKVAKRDILIKGWYYVCADNFTTAGKQD